MYLLCPLYCLIVAFHEANWLLIALYDQHNLLTRPFHFHSDCTQPPIHLAVFLFIKKEVRKKKNSRIKNCSFIHFLLNNQTARWLCTVHSPYYGDFWKWNSENYSSSLKYDEGKKEFSQKKNTLKTIWNSLIATLTVFKVLIFIWKH